MMFLTFLLRFSKTCKLWSSKAAFTIMFATINHNYDHKQRTLKHKNTHIRQKNRPITNHKPWSFEPAEVNFCFLRGPLRWLMAAKNANVSWLLNFRIHVFMKSTVNKVTILVVVFLSHREGEELFQFLFLETEIKNSWEAYFEDAKQKLGKCLFQRILKTVLFLCLLKFAFYL